MPYRPILNDTDGCDLFYIYAFSRRFYPKQFRLHIFCQYVCSLGIEPTTFTQCSTTEPQEHFYLL